MKESDSAMSQTNKKTVIEEVQVSDKPDLPSADLMNYFMKETKENFKDLKEQNSNQFNTLTDKLDKMTGSFLTKEEAVGLKGEHDKDIRAIWKKFDDQRWYWRALIVAVLTALAGELASLIFGNH